MRPTSDIAFSPTVKLIQESRGTREQFRQLEERGGWRSGITPEVAAFLARARSAFLSTVNADGQPYVQHRGGPPGFLRVLDERTLGLVDFKGNGQYVTVGNLRDNSKACLLVVDHEIRRRLKLWGRAAVVEGDGDLLSRLAVPGYDAKLDHAIVFSIEAWDTHVSAHIPRLIPAEDAERTIATLENRVRELEEQLAAVRTKR